MSDETDLASEREEIARQDAIRRAARSLAAGVAGICESCDEPSIRLVDGMCAQCRDIEEKRVRLNGREA